MPVLLITTIVLAGLTFCLVRNNDVFKFRVMVNELCYEYSIKTRSDGWKKFWDKMPGYGKMVFSFRAMKLESFFTPDEINELLQTKKQHI